MKGIITVLWIWPTLLFAGDLKLEDYLQQVEVKHQGIRASQLSSQGANLRSAEGDLMYFPGFFANAQWSSDAKQPLFFRYDKLISTTLSTGVTQATPFGLQAKLYYSLFSFNYVGSPLSPNSGFQTSPALELTQSFWRNGFGSETRAMHDQVEASALATHYGELQKLKLQRAEAEMSYWRLAIARENVTLQKAALERGKKLYDWSKSRVHLQLADQSDLLQAEAALDLHQLQLTSSLDQERSAARMFNLQRSEVSDRVEETLEVPTLEKISGFAAPVRAEEADEVKAAKEQARAIASQAELSYQRNSPVLDLVATASLNGLDTQFGESFSESFGTDYPTYTIGLKFSMPLGIGTQSDVRGGWEKEKESAEWSAKRKESESNAQWLDLTQRLEEARKILLISSEIEKIQERKLNNERERHRRGRSTTYQVLQFENDYSQGQLTRLQSMISVLEILAKMKTYQEERASL